MKRPEAGGRVLDLARVIFRGYIGMVENKMETTI